MNDLATKLKDAAEDVRVSESLPVAVRRRIRVRQSAVVGIAALSVVALAAGAFAISRPTGLIPPSSEQKRTSAQPIATGAAGGGYTVLLRQTESETCLYLNDQFKCRSSDLEGEALPIYVVDGSACRPSDGCGSDKLVVVIAGLVDEDVTRVGIRDDAGTSFVQVGPPAQEGAFSAEIYANPGDELELITYDSAGNVLGSFPIAIPGG
jgi:hypothetical protein